MGGMACLMASRELDDKKVIAHAMQSNLFGADFVEAIYFGNGRVKACFVSDTIHRVFLSLTHPMSLPRDAAAAAGPGTMRWPLTPSSLLDRTGAMTPLCGS